LINPPTQPSANAPPLKFKGPQKVDATLWLRLDDPAIDRDAKNFEILLKTARQVMKNPQHRHTSRILPALYKRWRGPLFPLVDRTSKPFPQWRDLSPWMKTQIAGLVLQEGQFRPIRVHLHDGLREELIAKGIDSKNYLRDRLSRTLRPVFGKVPMFYFVEEDFEKTGATNVRPHFHGAIQIRGVGPPTPWSSSLIPNRVSCVRTIVRMVHLNARWVSSCP
jgi:hypothetical protein